MKIYLTVFFFVALFFFSCKKLDVARVSKIQTVSIESANGLFKVVGSIIDIDKNGIQDHGFCWATTNNPGINDAHLSLGAVTKQGDFNGTIFDLSASQTYYVRAYLISNDATVYGENLTFNTNSNAIILDIDNPQVLNSTTIKIGGAIRNLGSLKIEEIGHCYAANKTPTINDVRSIIIGVNKDTSINSEFANLSTAVNFYEFRTYAKLSNAMVLYSASKQISIIPLKVSTDTFTAINSNTVNLKGSLVSLGVDPIAEYGFVYSSINPWPDYNDHIIINPASPKIGAFFNDLGNLSVGTTYYYRAFASNGSTIVYGTVKSIIK